MTTYQNIRTMMRAYINMDAFEITGSRDLDGQIDYYISRVSNKTLCLLIEEIKTFAQQNQQDITEAFNDAFDYGAEIEDANALFSLIRRKVAKHFDEAEEAAEAEAREEKLAQYRKMLVEDGIDPDELLKATGRRKELRRPRREKLYEHISQFLETAIEADNETDSLEPNETRQQHT